MARAAQCSCTQGKWRPVPCDSVSNASLHVTSGHVLSSARKHWVKLSHLPWRLKYFTFKHRRAWFVSRRLINIDDQVPRHLINIDDQVPQHLINIDDQVPRCLINIDDQVPRHLINIEDQVPWHLINIGDQVLRPLIYFAFKRRGA